MSRPQNNFWTLLKPQKEPISAPKINKSETHYKGDR